MNLNTLAPTVFVADSCGGIAVVDVVAVQRAVSGDQPPALTSDEAAIAARILHAQAVPLKTISSRTRLREDALREALGRRPRPRQVVVCGTHQGYARHRRNGEIPCAPFRAANAESDRLYRATGSRVGSPTVKAG